MSVERPRKGERYRHPRLRGTWTVESAGEKFVRIRCDLPFVPKETIPTPGFMRADWERVA